MHQEVVGIDVAAHQDIAVTAVDDINSFLGDIVAGSHVHHGVGLLFQTQLFQQGDGAGAVTNQNGLNETFLLGLEDAADHIFTVGTGQNDAERLFVLGEKTQDVFKIFQFHVVAFLLFEMRISLVIKTITLLVYWLYIGFSS